MKHLKIIGLAVVAAAAFMSFAGVGSASAAATLTSPAGTEYTGTMHATAEPGTTLLLKAVFANVTCTESTIHGHVTVNNSTHAEGPITSISFSNCGSNDPVAITLGSLTINQKTEVFGSNSAVTVLNTSTGADCAYGTTTNTKLGTFTQSTSNTSDATIDISASLPYIAAHSTTSQFLCGATGTWTGSYTVTTPTPLFSV